MPTNTRVFNGRGILIIEAPGNQSYQALSLSSVAVTGSSVTASVVATGTATDANFVAWIKSLFGIA